MSRNEAVRIRSAGQAPALHASALHCFHLVDVLTSTSGVAAAHKQDADCLAHKRQRPSALRDWLD
jgi:hypothetical protein